MKLTDKIAKDLIEIISFHLEEVAPLKIIQTKKKVTHFISQGTKEIIQQRDTTWTEYKTTSDQDTLRLHRTLKKRANKAIKQDKLNSQKNEMQEAAGSRDQWKAAKSQLGWQSHGGPKMLLKDGSPHHISQRNG